MKCNSCGGDWTPTPGRSITVCPFCNEPTQKPSDMLLNNVVKELVSQHGENVLLDSRLYSFVADKLQNKDPQTLKRIRLAINERVPQNIINLKSADELEQKFRMTAIATALRDEYDMGIATAYEIVNYFADAMGFKVLVVPQNSLDSQSMIIHTTHNETQSVQLLPKIQTEDEITVTPKIGSIIRFGAYDWRVLDVKNGKALILSERIIEKCQYNERLANRTWADCTLRSHLNGTFYNTFTLKEKACIEETRITTNNNPWYGTNGGKSTIDKIFLLSIVEVVQYFGDSGDLKNRKGWYFDWNWDKLVLKDGKGSNINDQYNTARIARDANDESSWWWLRSPGYGSDCAAGVGNDGSVGIFGYIVDGNGGVRPALWLNL